MIDVFPPGSGNSSGIVGKNCPYCQFPVKEADSAVVCSECGIPHHSECWRENGGCTTFGCSGAPTGGNASPGRAANAGSEWAGGDHWSNQRGPATPSSAATRFPCRQCGLQLGVTASFCPSCGMPVSADVPRAMPRAMPQTYPASVPSHLGWAVAATLLCCLPGGIVAIVYASQVGSKLQIGDYEGAVRVSNLAQTWCIVSAALGAVSLVIALIANSG